MLLSDERRDFLKGCAMVNWQQGASGNEWIDVYARFVEAEVLRRACAALDDTDLSPHKVLRRLRDEAEEGCKP